MSEASVMPEAGLQPSIRRAEARDFEAVRRLRALVQNVHAQEMPDVFQPAAATGFSHEEFEATLPDNLVLVAERGGEVVGSLHAIMRPVGQEGAYLPGNAVFILHVVTEPSARRSGVASALVAAAAEWAAENDALRIELAVWSFNAAALALYRKLGFGTAYTGMSITPSEMLGRHGGGRLPQRLLPGFLQRILKR